MKLLNQSTPIRRKLGFVRVSKGVLPRACFEDCMEKIYGIPQCRSAFQSRDAGGIASCLINFGLNVARPIVAVNIAQCVARCQFGVTGLPL
jgi:hypothetical protein